MTPVAMDSEHAIVLAPCFVVQIWRRTLAAAVRDNIRILTDYLRRTEGKVAYLVIIEANGEPPDKEARVLLDELAALLIPRGAVLAYAYQGTGLKAITIRAIMTGLSLAQRHDAPVKIAATTNEALAFIAKHSKQGTAIERSQIVAAALNAFRTQGHG